MARTARIKIEGDGVAWYHVTSRTNDKRFLFSESAVKDRMVETLERAAAFSGVEIVAYAVMDNHFHVVVKVVRGGPRPDEAELLRRVAAMKGPDAAAELGRKWDALRAGGCADALEKERNRLRVRMDDVSAFVKTFKEAFNVWYKKNAKYCGSLWSGRFASTLIEDGEYLASCVRYVVNNPVRAKIVADARSYRWSRAACDSAARAGTVPGAEEETRNHAGTVPGAEEGPRAGCAWKAGPRVKVEVGEKRRVAQFAAGKIFGSEAFVERILRDVRGKLYAARVVARAVGTMRNEATAYSSHGWHLAM